MERAGEIQLIVITIVIIEEMNGSDECIRGECNICYKQDQTVLRNSNLLIVQYKVTQQIFSLS